MADLVHYTTPDGLVFALGAKRRPPDPREWAFEFVPPTAVDRSAPRSLAAFFPACFDQGTEGSCTANSSVAVQMACAALAGQTPVMLSREDLYYLERVKEGTFPGDVGAYPADSFDCVLTAGGLPAESDWAYDGNAAEQPPAGLTAKPKLLYIAGHQPIAGSNFVDGTIAALDAKQPLILAFSFYQEFYAQYQQTGILAAAPSSAVVGGHQVAVKGWIPAQGGLIWCQNSWGATSPARTDLHPDAKAGDIFFPIALCANGVIEEIRAAQAKTPQPGPQPTSLACTLSGPAAATVGAPASFLASGSGAAKPLFCLDFGDGVQTPWQPGGSAVHVYTKPGTYTATAWLGDGTTGKYSAPATIAVTVSAAPGAMAIARLSATFTDSSIRQVFP